MEFGKMEPLEGLVIIITFLTMDGAVASRIDVTFFNEDLLALNGPIHKYSTEAVELLHNFEQSFLAAGNGLLEPCDRDHHLRMEDIRNRQNYQINLVPLPIDLARLGTILNSTWHEVKKTPDFCKFHPFWKKEQTDLTCDERLGVCCSVSQVKGRGGCAAGSHLRKDRYYWPTTTTTLRPSTTSTSTTTTMTTTVAISTATTPAITAFAEALTTTATTTAPPPATSSSVITTTELRTTTTDTPSSSPEVNTSHSQNQSSVPESPGDRRSTKSPAIVTAPVVNPLLLLIFIIFALIVVSLLSICRYL